MSFIELDAPSEYDVLETTPRSAQSRARTWAIIIRTKDYSGTFTGWEILVPDAGEKAHELLKMYRDRERKSRISANEREQEFQNSLLEEHNFMLENRKTGLCYCGKIASDEIHTEEQDSDHAH